MRTLVFVSAGVAGLGLLVGSIASSAGVPQLAAIAASRGTHASAILRRPGLRNHAPPTPTPCSSNFGTASFNAIQGVADHAGGDDSAVLAGTNDDACDQSTAVGGGDHNVVGVGASQSFIGAGYFNGVSGVQSGVLAGQENNVAAQAAGVGAGSSNSIYSNGIYSFIGAGVSNRITDTEAFVGAGASNSAGSFSFVGAGSGNVSGDGSAFVGAGGSNDALGIASFVGGGVLNQVTGTGLGFPSLVGAGSFIGAGGAQWGIATEANSNPGPGNQISGEDSFIGAGNLNRITGNGSIIGAGGSAVASGKKDVPNDQITGNDSFIGAGDSNSVSANEAFIGSGQGNSIAAAATYSAIAGGGSNTAGNSYAAVGGGEHNNATGAAAVVGGGAYSTAQGSYATVPGGYLNAADGSGSFAAGTLAKARNNGAFVWNDNSTTAELQSTANYQFVARATGGFYLYTNTAATIGAKLAPNSGTWASASDRNMKADVVPLDDAAVLAKVAALPISEWSYKTEGGVRHVGPMAQDFYAAFRVGEDDLHITSIDEDGVALAAIKALHAENARMVADDAKMRADNAGLHSENIALRNRLAALEQKVAALATRRSER
jgi:hypothetical protein